MPIFNIKVAGTLDNTKKKELFRQVAETISRVKDCPLSAISGTIEEIPLDGIGQGNYTWEDILNDKTKCS